MWWACLQKQRGPRLAPQGSADSEPKSYAGSCGCACACLPLAGSKPASKQAVALSATDHVTPSAGPPAIPGPVHLSLEQPSSAATLAARQPLVRGNMVSQVPAAAAPMEYPASLPPGVNAERSSQPAPTATEKVGVRFASQSTPPPSTAGSVEVAPHHLAAAPHHLEAAPHHVAPAPPTEYHPAPGPSLAPASALPPNVDPTSSPTQGAHNIVRDSNNSSDPASALGAVHDNTLDVSSAEKCRGSKAYLSQGCGAIGVTILHPNCQARISNQLPFHSVTAHAESCSAEDLQVIHDVIPATEQPQELHIRELVTPTPNAGSTYRGTYQSRAVTIRMVPVASDGLALGLTYNSSAAAKSAAPEPQHVVLAEYCASLASQPHSNLARIYVAKVHYVCCPIQDDDHCSGRYSVTNATSAEEGNLSVPRHRTSEATRSRQSHSSGGDVRQSDSRSVLPREHSSPATGIASPYVPPNRAQTLASKLLSSIRSLRAPSASTAAATRPLSSHASATTTQPADSFSGLAGLGSSKLRSMLAGVSPPANSAASGRPPRPPVLRSSSLPPTATIIQSAQFVAGTQQQEQAQSLIEEMIRTQRLASSASVKPTSGSTSTFNANQLRRISPAISGNSVLGLPFKRADSFPTFSPFVASDVGLRSSLVRTSLVRRPPSGEGRSPLATAARGSVERRSRGEDSSGLLSRFMSSVRRLVSETGGSMDGHQPTGSSAEVLDRLSRRSHRHQFRCRRECILVIIQEECVFTTLTRALLNHRFYDLRHCLPRLEMVVEVAREISCGLVHLHACCLVAGALSPDSIIMQRESASLSGFATKLSDYGMAGMKLGNMSSTVPYAKFYQSPEVAATGVCSKAGDVYSFGVVLWELYFSHPCFITAGEGPEAGGFETHPDFPLFPPDCPQDYALLAEWCLCHDPQARPSIKRVAHQLHSLKRLIMRNLAELFHDLGLSPVGSIRTSKASSLDSGHSGSYAVNSRAPVVHEGSTSKACSLDGTHSGAYSVNSHTLVSFEGWDQLRTNPSSPGRLPSTAASLVAFRMVGNSRQKIDQVHPTPGHQLQSECVPTQEPQPQAVVVSHTQAGPVRSLSSPNAEGGSSQRVGPSDRQQAGGSSICVFSSAATFQPAAVVGDADAQPASSTSLLSVSSTSLAAVSSTSLPAVSSKEDRRSTVPGTPPAAASAEEDARWSCPPCNQRADTSWRKAPSLHQSMMHQSMMHQSMIRELGVRGMKRTWSRLHPIESRVCASTQKPASSGSQDEMLLALPPLPVPEGEQALSLADLVMQRAYALGLVSFDSEPNSQFSMGEQSSASPRDDAASVPSFAGSRERSTAGSGERFLAPHFRDSSRFSSRLHSSVGRPFAQLHSDGGQDDTWRRFNPASATLLHLPPAQTHHPTSATSIALEHMRSTCSSNRSSGGGSVKAVMAWQRVQMQEAGRWGGSSGGSSNYSSGKTDDGSGKGDDSGRGEGNSSPKPRPSPGTAAVYGLRSVQDGIRSRSGGCGRLMSHSTSMGSRSHQSASTVPGRSIRQGSTCSSAESSGIAYGVLASSSYGADADEVAMQAAVQWRSGKRTTIPDCFNSHRVAIPEDAMLEVPDPTHEAY